MFFFSNPFGKTRRWFEDRGVDADATERKSVSMTTDFGEAIRRGKIDFDDGYLWFDHEGVRLRGYAYMYNYNLERWSQGPKLHFFKCKTIIDFEAKDMFRQKYVWSNLSLNDVECRTTGKVWADFSLGVCGNCMREAGERYDDSEDFHELVVAPQLRDADLGRLAPKRPVEVRHDGYTADWKDVSDRVRAAADYRCDACDVHLPGPTERGYLHVHHRNGDKADNRPTNLQPLCRLCHAHVDEAHRRNLLHGPVNERQIEGFTRACRQRLERSGNRYYR